MEGYVFLFTIWPLAVSQISFESDVPPRTLGVPVQEHYITQSLSQWPHLV